MFPWPAQNILENNLFWDSCQDIHINLCVQGCHWISFEEFVVNVCWMLLSGVCHVEFNLKRCHDKKQRSSQAFMHNILIRSFMCLTSIHLCINLHIHMLNRLVNVVYFPRTWNYIRLCKVGQSFSQFTKLKLQIIRILNEICKSSRNLNSIKGLNFSCLLLQYS